MCYICLQNSCPPQCLNYEPQKAKLYCSYCDEGIYGGEKYIENQECEYRHLDCFGDMKDLSEWLGCEVKTMEENYD